MSINLKNFRMLLDGDDGAPSGGGTNAPQPTPSEAPPSPSPDPQGGSNPQGIVGDPPATAPGEDPAPTPSTPIPDHLKTRESVKDFKSLEKLVDSYENAQKMVGERIVPRPAPDAPKEDWDKFRKALGVPESAEGYKLQMEKYPESLTEKEEITALENFLKETAYEANLAPEQAQLLHRKLINHLGEQASKNPERLQQQVDTWIGEAKQKFGKAYDQTLETGRRAIQHAASPEFKKFLVDTGMAYHPGMIEFAAELGKNLLEATGQAGSGAGFQSTLTPEQAQAEIKRLQSDKEFMSHYLGSIGSKNSKEHKDAVAKMQRLYEYAYPEGNQESW